MKIYLATWLEEKAQKTVLDNKAKRERLLSYFYIIKRLAEFKEYVR